MDTTLRPWQGTTLGVLSYISVALSILIGISLIFGLNFLSDFLAEHRRVLSKALQILVLSLRNPQPQPALSSVV